MRAVRLLFLALPAFAQFGGLATNFDGSELHFTSTLRQTGSQQHTYGKVFRLKDQQLQAELVVEPTGDVNGSNFYMIHSPLLDERGQFAGYYASRMGTNLQRCRDASCNATLYKNRGYSSRLHFSRSKRYAVSEYDQGLGFYLYMLFDLSTEPPQRLAVVSDAGGVGLDGSLIAVTDDGHVYLTDQLLKHFSAATKELRADVVLEVSSDGNWKTPVASADHKRILAWQYPRGQLIALDRATSTTRPLADASPGTLCKLKLTPDEVLIGLCEDAAHKYTLRQLRADSDHWETVVSIAVSVKEWTLSGSGDIVWYLSTDSAFHQVSLSRRTDVTRLPAQGSFQSASVVNVVSPGSLFFIEGSGLERYSLNLLTAGGQKKLLPPVMRSESNVAYQFPWDLSPPSRGDSLELSSDQPSPFELRQSLSLVTNGTPPRFLQLGTLGQIVPDLGTNLGTVLAAHGDFSGLVTRENPARSGEVVHFWGIHLGPVVGPVETGKPAPLDSLRPVATTGFGCGLFGSAAPVGVLFAGLAPGMIGVYQITLQLPSVPLPLTAPSSYFVTRCGFNGFISMYAALPATP